MNLSFSQFYVKFRASAWFLAFLVGTCVSWLGAHWLFGMDRDLGGLNIFLSFEASISLAFFAMVSEFQYREQKTQSETMQSILTQLQANDSKLMEVVEDIHEEVEGK
jgi:hypothetical protein